MKPAFPLAGPRTADTAHPSEYPATRNPGRYDARSAQGLPPVRSAGTTGYGGSGLFPDQRNDSLLYKAADPTLPCSRWRRQSLQPEPPDLGETAESAPHPAWYRLQSE